MKERGISIATAFNYAIPIEEQLPLIAEAGFTHVSLGAKEAHSRYLSAADRLSLKALLQQHSLAVDTIHGPRADLPESVDRLSVVAASAADLMAPVIVLHAGPFGFQEAELPTRLETVLRTCSKLEAVARDTGRIFALENVLPGPATDLVQAALRQLNPEYFGFCYDSSHDQIGGPKPFDLLLALRERLVAVHLSDRIRDYVDHVPPREGFIDWSTLAIVLKATPFEGPLLFEVSVEHSTEKDTRRFLKRTYERAHQVRALMQAT